MSDADWKNWQNGAHPQWWRDRGLRKCMLNILILYGSVFANGYDSGIINSSQALPSWLSYFNNPSGGILGAIVAGYAFPQLVFPIPAAYIGDRYGRRLIIFIGAVCGIAGPLLSGFGNSVGTYIGGRIWTGISCAIFQTTAAPLISEIAHPRFRAVAQGSFFTTYFIGNFLVGWLGFGFVNWESEWGWRIMTILQGLGCVPIIFWSATPWMAESPRYLIRKGQHQRALRILADFHANGDEHDELVVNEFREIVVAVELDAQASQTSYMDFFKTKGNRKRFWNIVWVAWASSMVGNNIAAYYFTPILVSVGVTKFVEIQGILGGFSVLAWVCCLGGAQLLARWGRRITALVSLTMMVLFFTITTGLSAGYDHTGNKNTGITAIPFIFLFILAFLFCFNPFPYLYLPEILPYALRTKGMGLFSVLQACGQVFGAYVNGIALGAIGWKYYILYIVGDAILGVIGYFVLVETKGKTLEEIAILFDGNDALISEAADVKLPAIEMTEDVAKPEANLSREHVAELRA